MGMKNDPIFRVVVTDSRFKRDGRFIENVGHYNPIAPGGTQVTLKNDRILHWLSVGAQPSDTVWSILKKSGIPKPLHQRKSKKSNKSETAQKSVAKA
jgi:small subunit ribosomal protein S16